MNKFEEINEKFGPHKINEQLQFICYNYNLCWVKFEKLGTKPITRYVEEIKSKK